MRAGRLIAALIGLTALSVAVVAQRVATRALPKFEPNPSPSPGTLAVGALHVHSRASHDCQLAVEVIAHAAKQASLDFVIITDHDAQIPAPGIVDGVLVLAFAELSTSSGHVLALGARELVPPAERDGARVFDAIRARGGTPIVAHPTDSSRPWTGELAGAAGIEIANLSSAARHKGGRLRIGLLGELLTYPLNPDLAVAQIYERDGAALSIWDTVSEPSFVGLCGVDAHGLIDVTLNLQGWNVALEEPLPAGAAARARAIVRSLERGRFHCVAGLLGARPHFRFGALRRGRWVASAGETIQAQSLDELRLEGPVLKGAQPTLLVYRDAREVARAQGDLIELSAPEPGVYRAEVWAPVPRLISGDAVVPIIYSNKIRILPKP